MIEIRNLHKAFGPQKVLDGVNLTVQEGEVLAIMGPSGTGKSVLLKHLIGLIRPDAGEIFVDSEEITDLPSREMNVVRRKFGVLFQDAALFDDMSVFDNVSFPLYEHTPLSDDEIRQKVAEKLDEVGLKDADQKWPSELSGGMRKRAGLARALMLDPKVLLFDEPTTGLDPIITDQIADLIEATHERHKTTAVIISHDLFLAYRLADHIAMLFEGKIVEFVTPQELPHSRHPFVRKFLEAQKANEGTM